MRKVLPRQFEALKGLEMLDLSNAVWQGGVYAMVPAAFPTVQQAFLAMQEAGGRMLQMAQGAGALAAKMVEYPDELLAAVNASTKIQVREVKEMFKNNPQVKTIGMFIHNGMDMFMSREQFETFYWPGFKAVVDAIVECGGIPYIFLEDCYDSKILLQTVNRNLVYIAYKKESRLYISIEMGLFFSTILMEHYS